MEKIDWFGMVSLAEEILEMRPWEDYLENEVFAIQPHEKSPIYFVSVMGNLGEHHAIAYYPGFESFSAFRAVMGNEIPQRILTEVMLLNGHLQVVFEQRKFLNPPELQILKGLGKSYRGKWPAFRSHRPARMPWIVNPGEARDLERLMKETLLVLQRCSDDIMQSCEADEFFLRTWDGRDSTCRIGDLPQHRHVIQAELPKGALQGLENVPAIFEVELMLVPTPIPDVPKGEPPFFPMLLLVAEASSGSIIGMEMLSTVDGEDGVFARLPGALTEILKKARIVPSRLAARHPILCSLLQAYGKVYGIKFQKKENLPAVDRAAESLLKIL